jgi:glutamate carboxypeptidase
VALAGISEFGGSVQKAMISRLAEIVRHESPSRDKPALDALANLLAGWLRDAGAAVEIIPNAQGGNHLIGRFSGPAGQRPALVLTHFDTVWPIGTLERMPFRLDETGRAHGPGVFDMKASLVVLLAVMDQLHKNPHLLPRPVWALFTSDEELGSPTSREHIEALAVVSAYALVLEPALADGGLKTARKGVGRFLLDVEGKAAHAGVAPQHGRNAIVELAHQILKLGDFQDPPAGTTVNVGVVRGGTTTNVVPAHASAEIDVRVATRAEEARIESALRALCPVNPENRLTLSGSFNRPPMERTDANATLFEKARQLARAAPLGFELTEGSSGGGSDGNFTSALGIPTLDGLGPRGSGAHADDENVLIDSLPERAALIHRLLTGL